MAAYKEGYMKRLNNKNNSHWNAGHVLILLILTCLCYWPLTFGIFSAKNDNIQQFLPVRFHVSEALRNGHLPLWSPYIYTGYPIHGDTQGGAWNPVVWILSVFGRYNVTSLHFEILACILIAGCGMYRLLGIRNIPGNIKLAGAAVYMMCGFITDVAGSNLPFLWAAAYAPFVFAYYYELLKRPGITNAIKTAVALSLLLSSAYPSFFILTVYILLAAFCVVVARMLLQKNRHELKQVMLYHILTAVFFAGLSSVVIASYLHILSYYDRGNGVELSQVFVNSFHPSCSASLILPLVPFKNPASFVTDLISRNSYFNILLLMFLFAYIRMQKTIFLNFIFAGMLFFFLFALGDATPLRELCYHIMPLMNTFRHPSNARLFLIIGGIVAGIVILHSSLPLSYNRFFRILTYIFFAGMAIALVISLRGLQIFPALNELTTPGVDTRKALKTFLDNLSLDDVLFVNTTIQVITIALFYFLWKKKTPNTKWLAGLLIAHSFILAQLVIPYTLVSKVSPVHINALLRNYPKGYPDPGIQSIRVNSLDVLDNYDVIGINGFYNKKISLTDVTFTPTFMKPIEKLLADSLLKQLSYANPYAFFAGEISSNKPQQLSSAIITRDSGLLNMKQVSPGHFDLLSLTNNSFEFRFSTRDSSVFCLQQLLIPGWKAELNGKPTEIYAVNGAYMAIKLPGGEHHARIFYRPTSIIIGLIITIISIITLVFIFLKSTGRR